jgi:hypothetical protein
VKDQALVTGKQIADKIDLSRSGNTLQPVNPARPLPLRMFGPGAWLKKTTVLLSGRYRKCWAFLKNENPFDGCAAIVIEIGGGIQNECFPGRNILRRF